MIYTNFGTNPAEDYVRVMETKGMKSVDAWTTEDENPIFYYDRHDQSIRRIEFRDFISDEQWEHFKSNEEAIIVINFADDYLNQVDLDRFASDIKFREVDSSRIIFVLMDQNYVNFVIEGLKERGVYNCSTDFINILMKRVPPRYNKPLETTHKFSIFSRNYWSWRLDIYLELLKRGVLQNTNYSFHNINPYLHKTFTLDQLKDDAKTEGHEITPEVEEWIDNVPYDLGNANHKWSQVIYDAIDSSDFHIIIESHFDPFLGPNFQGAKNKYTPLNIAPGFITEKVWKAISSKKPFFIAGTPYIMKDLRKLGYKTFGDFIDESYDEIIDDKKRLKAFVTEIERINNLPEDEFKQLISSMQEVIEYNHSLYISQWENTTFVKYPFLHGIVVL